MPRPSPLLLLLPLACGPANTGDTGDTSDTDTTTTPASSSTTEPATTAPTTGEPATTDSSTSPTSSTTTTTTTTDSTTTPGTETTATTGELEFCQGWQGPQGAPFLDLYDKNNTLLQDGGVLPIECGGQGLFMFGLYPEFGGFIPPGDILDVDLVVDVEGFNNNPEGHFYSAHPVGYYVACDDIIGGVYGVIPIFPLDNLDDLTALDGKPAQVHVILPTGDEPLAVDLDVTLSVVKDDTWGFCGG